MFDAPSQRLSASRITSRLSIPHDVLAATVTGLRSRSDGRVESACMWIGDRATGYIKRVIFHHELADDRATALSLELPEYAKFALYQQLAKTKESILALLHTHPEDWVDLSRIDQANQISSRVGFWSIVLPYYAQAAWDISTVGFHIRQHDGWIRLTDVEIASAFKVIGS